MFVPVQARGDFHPPCGCYGGTMLKSAFGRGFRQRQTRHQKHEPVAFQISMGGGDLKPLKWSPDQSKYPPGFYTYRLIDPRNDLPFYVGKGQRDRAWMHERHVRSGRAKGESRKDETIRAIIASGAEVLIDIVAVYQTEAEALDHEYRLVDASSTLTNIAPGGGGAGNSPAVLQRRAQIRSVRKFEAHQRKIDAAFFKS